MAARDYDENDEIENRVQTMVPEVVLAVESLELATPERIHSCLVQRNINATRSETEMALEFGCKLGVMEEKRRYRLNPDLQNALLKSSSQIKESSESIMNKDKSERYSDNDDCSCSSYGEDYDSGSDDSEKRPRSDEEMVEYYENDEYK